MSKAEYTIPRPTLTEHEYAYATVLELQGIRAALEAQTVAITRIADSLQAKQEQEVALREPKPKPKRGDP